MTHSADTARIAPDERFRELAAILAAAVVRLNERTTLPLNRNFLASGHPTTSTSTDELRDAPSAEHQEVARQPRAANLLTTG
jgi:hypothetical protein